MWITALVLGFVGSLHCLVMCSPLAMAVTNLRSRFLLNRVVYNGGRILCYGFLGFLFSSFGSLFKLSGIQNFLTIMLGCLLIVVGLAGTRYIRVPVLSNMIYQLSAILKSQFSKFLKGNKLLSMALLGVLNGLLPCGLTYIALSYCLTLDGALNGFAFMLIFGIGTLPVMLGLTSIIQRIVSRVHLRTQYLTTIVMITLGVMLISRGAFVHYQSPAEPDTIVICK